MRSQITHNRFKNKMKKSFEKGRDGRLLQEEVAHATHKGKPSGCLGEILRLARTQMCHAHATHKGKPPGCLGESLHVEVAHALLCHSCLRPACVGEPLRAKVAHALRIPLACRASQTAPIPLDRPVGTHQPTCSRRAWHLHAKSHV